jgi:thiol-disulfide isomerase/thioredoxin
MIKAAFIAIAVSLGFSAAAQQEISKDAEGNKIIKGFMTRKDLASDSAFAWFAQNQAGFAPNADAVNAFRNQKDSIHILAFGGTWCGDTKYILPKFYMLADAAGLPESRITLVGVDRSKKTVHNLTEPFGITNVPTFIVLKNGKEIGRVVEYGKYGLVDKELGEIVAGPKKEPAPKKK